MANKFHHIVADDEERKKKTGCPFSVIFFNSVKYSCDERFNYKGELFSFVIFCK